MDRQLTFEILLYLNMFYTMFYAGIETFFFFMKYLYVPDFGKLLQKSSGDAIVCPFIHVNFVWSYKYLSFKLKALICVLSWPQA